MYKLGFLGSITAVCRHKSQSACGTKNQPQQFTRCGCKLFIELPSVGDVFPEEVALVLSVEQDNGLELVGVRALVLLHLEILVISALLDEVKLGLAEGLFVPGIADEEVRIAELFVKNTAANS